VTRNDLFAMKQRLSKLDAELETLGSGRELDARQEQRFETALRSRDALARDTEILENRLRDNLDALRARATNEFPGAMPAGGFPDDTETRTLEPAQNAALRMIERESSTYGLRSHQLDRADMLVRSDSTFAKWVEIHGRPEYGTAFGKIATRGETGASVSMTEMERQAMADSFEFRAQSETSGSGGYAVPVFIDPTLLLTNQESPNPFLQIARQVEVNTSSWKGVSSAGVSWSFDQEAAEVSDDSLTSITQPSVTVFMARGFVPFSIEISEDWPGFQSEMARVLMAGYDELLVDKFTRGSGTNEPMGILTSLSTASPTVIVTSTTDGAFGQEDVYNTWAALPSKFRRNASWMMNVDVMDRIRQFGSSTNWHAVTVQLPDGAVDRLMNRPVYEGTYFPTFSSTTGASNRLVVGDWSEFVVARRTGMTVELVPHLFGSSQRPTGQRGFFAYARIGSNSVMNGAFAMQSNT
jgi:HK97 family phage major capsid protein